MTEKRKPEEIPDDDEELSPEWKREHVALAVAKICSDGPKRDLFVAKITTKNGKRKVLKYEKPEHRTKRRRRLR